MADRTTVSMPAKHDLCGVGISAADYTAAVQAILAVADQKQSAIVSLLPVHGVVTAAYDPVYRAKINGFDLVAPDGQPVRWGLNYFHRTGLADRVYGPELMRRLCAAAAEEGLGIYLYGSSPEVLERLQANLRRQFPALRIVGAEAPPFRALTAEEDEAAVARINASGADLVFIGLGLPRQEAFAYDHRERIRGVQLCVGAAFDFHAGTKKTAPRWMQDHGLEWAFRLLQEPRRLWRRYLVTNTLFALLMARLALRRIWVRT